MIRPERSVSGGFLASAPAEVTVTVRPEAAAPGAVFREPDWPADPEPDDDGEG